MHEGSKKAIFAAFFANLGIAFAKVAAAVITGSASLLAEAIHSFADTGNQGLLLLGGRRARRAPDARHPFGYGAERFFWAFVVALVLFSLGALFSLYEGIDKLLHPTTSRVLGSRSSCSVSRSGSKAGRCAPRSGSPIPIVMVARGSGSFARPRTPNFPSYSSRTPVLSPGW